MHLMNVIINYADHADSILNIRFPCNKMLNFTLQIVVQVHCVAKNINLFLKIYVIINKL